MPSVSTDAFLVFVIKVQGKFVANIFVGWNGKGSISNNDFRSVLFKLKEKYVTRSADT